MDVFIEGYKNRMYDFFRWRSETGFVYKLAMCFSFACFTGLMAQVRFYLPFTPVPVTGQTFAVLFSALILGRYYGALSQTIYAGLGFAGIPWFAGFSCGLGVLLGPTGGYIIGFILAALFIGMVVDRSIKARSFANLVCIMAIADFALIFIPGVLWLYCWLAWIGFNVTISQVMWMGYIPFIPGDIIKVFVVAGIAWIIVPKTAYNGERKPKHWIL